MNYQLGRTGLYVPPPTGGGGGVATYDDLDPAAAPGTLDLTLDTGRVFQALSISGQIVWVWTEDYDEISSYCSNASGVSYFTLADDLAALAARGWTVAPSATKAAGGPLVLYGATGDYLYFIPTVLTYDILGYVKVVLDDLDCTSGWHASVIFQVEANLRQYGSFAPSGTEGYFEWCDDSMNPITSTAYGIGRQDTPLDANGIWLRFRIRGSGLHNNSQLGAAVTALNELAAGTGAPRNYDGKNTNGTYSGSGWGPIGFYIGGGNPGNALKITDMHLFKIA